MDALFHIFLITVLGGSGAMLVYRSRYRTATDVLETLQELDASGEDNGLNLRRQEFLKNDEFVKLGLFSREDRKRFELQKKLLPLGGALIAVLVSLAFFRAEFPAPLVFAGTGAALGYIVQSTRVRRMRERYIQQIEFYLPVIMERMVMAVQAGLDVLPAIQSIIEVDQQKNKKIKRDPVSELLDFVYRLTESGIPFDQSLKEVAGMVECSPLRHAFLHLGNSQREGGELMMPLRELSDSTQLYFQESVEEMIAKMPVKATLPLVITFAGLIVFFLIAPFMQLFETMGNAITVLDQ